MTTTAKVLQVLALFDETRESVRVEQIARSLGVSLATAYRYVADLSAAGLIERASEGEYVLGPRIVELDRQVRMHDPLLAASKDIMESLAGGTGGTVLLARLHATQVLCVHQVPGRFSPPRISYERGRVMPILRGATSKVILAHVGPQVLRQIVASEKRALRAAGLPTHYDALVGLLTQIRSDGFCIAAGEVDREAVGIAAPIHHGATLLGSLSAVVSSKHPISGRRRLADQVMRAAIRIEARLEVR